MAINFKDIKQNFFIDYLKYWIIFFLLLSIYLLNGIRKYYFSTSNIIANVDDAMYITSGVAINDKYVIADKKTIEESCFGRLTETRGDFYIVDSRSIYGAAIDKGDAINNMVLLRLKNNQDSLDNYAILDLGQPKYSVNKRFIVPIVLNRPGKFNFKLVRAVASKDSNFFIAIKNSLKRSGLSGMPVFNRNYVLQGIIREENDKYSEMTNRDRILNKANIQETYLVNGIDTVKNFLNRYNIEYSVIDGNVNLNNEKYNPKASVVNIICVQKY